MDVEQVKKRVESIRYEGMVKRDHEAAHCEEDHLRADLLRAIAAGECADPAACAAEALKTEDMDFQRWCA